MALPAIGAALKAAKAAKKLKGKEKANRRLEEMKDKEKFTSGTQLLPT